MRKNLNFSMMLIYLSGMILRLISSFFSNSLNDFTIGFLDGMSMVFVISSFIYMCWCFSHKKNPFKWEEK